MDMDLFQPEERPSQEGERTLICSCPKCSATIERALTQIVEDSPLNNCPACKSRYVLTRESFARRASRKAGQINCAQCGEPLDHSQYCPSCKALYPDYYAAEFPDAAKKRARQNRDLFRGLKSFSFEWRSSSSAPSIDYKPVLLDSEPWQETTRWKKKNIVLGLSVVVIAALIALGTSLYSQTKAKKQYAESYIMALYGIKLGTDFSLKACNKISADWAVKSVPPQLTVDEESQLNTIKEKTGKYLQQMGEPPSEFAASNERLLKLNELFLKLHAAALKPSGTITSFAGLTQKTESDFKVASADLKNNMPAELSKLLTIAKTKYSALKNF